MRYVYIIESTSSPGRHYVGSTNDLKRRIQEHNSGESTHTNKYTPWKIKTYLGFSDNEKADEFEEFLKTGNGRIFMKKRM